MCLAEELHVSDTVLYIVTGIGYAHSMTPSKPVMRSNSKVKVTKVSPAKMEKLWKGKGCEKD